MDNDKRNVRVRTRNVRGNLRQSIDSVIVEGSTGTITQFNVGRNHTLETTVRAYYDDNDVWRVSATVRRYRHTQTIMQRINSSIRGFFGR